MKSDEKKTQKAWNIKIQLTQLLPFNGKGEPKGTLRERMDVRWMDGIVWMTIRMTFGETNNASTKQKLYVIIHVIASKRKRTKAKAF